MPCSRSIAACAFDAAMSSRHKRLSKPIEALMRVISASGPLPNRPPQVRCESRCEGGLSAMRRRVAMSGKGGQTQRMTSDSIRAARQALKEGRIEVAAEMADAILAQAAHDLDALEIKALAAVEGHDHQTAENALRKAIALAPDRRWPYADLTRLLLKLRRSADAEAVSRQALAADPNNADAHAMLGSMLAERENWFDAAMHFEHAIALAGRHSQLLTGLGLARMRSGRVDEARRLLEEAGKADP